MKNLLLRPALAVAFCLAIMVGPAAGGPIQLSIDPNPITGAPGDMIDIHYTIFNGTLDVVELQGVSVNVDSNIGEFTDLFDGLLQTIEPGVANTGLLGTFKFSASAPVDRYAAAFLVDVGVPWTDDTGQQSEGVWAEVNVEVTPVPEPATFTVTLLGLGLTLGFARRRR